MTREDSDSYADPFDHSSHQLDGNTEVVAPKPPEMTLKKQQIIRHMKDIKRFGALIIGAIFFYDFLITFASNSAEQYEVIGMEVTKITYLAYLLAVAVSFLSYGFTTQIQNEIKSADTQGSVGDK